MRGYTLAIMEAIDGITQRDADEIEEIMRQKYHTLDRLTEKEFRVGAKIAWLTVQELRSSNKDFVKRSDE